MLLIQIRDFHYLKLSFVTRYLIITGDIAVCNLYKQMVEITVLCHV